jgi:hypothetical protein
MERCRGTHTETLREELGHLDGPAPRAGPHIKDAGGMGDRCGIVAAESVAQDQDIVLEVEAVRVGHGKQVELVDTAQTICCQARSSLLQYPPQGEGYSHTRM